MWKFLLVLITSWIKGITSVDKPIYVYRLVMRKPAASQNEEMETALKVKLT